MGGRVAAVRRAAAALLWVLGWCASTGCTSPDRFSHPVQQDEAVWEFDSWGVDLPAALHLLAELVGGSSITPNVNCKGAFCAPSRPQLPAGGVAGPLMATSGC